MTALRDTYSDYFTHRDAVECGRAEIVERALAERTAALRQRSGAVNVSNASLLLHHSWDAEALLMRIVFNSSAWTGR